MTTLLHRLAGLLPWLRQGHVRVCARTAPEQWDSLFDTAADAAHALDQQVSCSGTWDEPWSIGMVDIGCYRMSRRAIEALRDRVLIAVRAHDPAPTETLGTLCYPCSSCIWEDSL